MNYKNVLSLLLKAEKKEKEMSENGQRIFAFRKLKVIIIKQKNLTVSVNSGYMFYRNRNKI